MPQAGRSTAISTKPVMQGPLSTALTAGAGVGAEVVCGGTGCEQAVSNTVAATAMLVLMIPRPG
jgi:hypothetical protein